MNEIAINKIVNIMKGLADTSNRPDNLIFGTVATINPLSVDIGNNIVLPETMLILGQNCRPHRVTIPHSHLVNAFLSDKTKAINTTGIAAGVSTDVPQNTASYDVKTQKITANDDEGTNERELQTETKTNVDLGGAGLKMKIEVSGSAVSTSGGAGSVTGTNDASTFTVSDKGHSHIIPEHQTQDVHFPNTEYEDSVEMEIYPRLKVGDTVLMFAFNNYQKYYVAERIE